MLNEVRCHTTLPAADLERAKRFYSEKLGLEPTTEASSGIFYTTGGGAVFSLYPTPNPTRGGHTQMGFAVADIDAAVADLRSRGVEFEGYDFPGLKTVNGIADIGDGRAAWFLDSEGNTIGIVQLPPGVFPAG